jgi:hypothetical protein
MLGLILWFSLRMARKRAARKREENANFAFMSVRGVVKDDNAVSRPIGPSLSYSITMPEKATTRQSGQTKRDTFRQQLGTPIPRPFSPKPFAIAMAAASGPPDGPDSSRRPTSLGHRLSLSFGSEKSRFSVFSSISNTSQDPTTGIKRKVRQVFTPLLPDELLVSVLGEQLNVIQSFDDGWCLAGRENSIYTSAAKSLFKQSPRSSEGVELGVVPVWCFIKPVKGLRVERPVRSSSLGITVQMQGPGYSSRDEVISWSNF